MSEFSHSRRWGNRKLAKRLGAVTAIAAIYGAGVGTHAEFFKDSKVSAGDIAVEAQNMIKSYNFAVTQADSYANALNDPVTKKIPMQILNGEIQLLAVNNITGKGGAPTVYKNPIILSRLNPNTEPDASGNFLEGAWLAIQNNTEGHVSFNVIPFDPTHEAFKAYNSHQIVINDLAVYTQHSSEGPTLIAFDPTGNRFLENPDHTTIQPGLMTEAGN
jgi:hypothetical protein